MELERLLSASDQDSDVFSARAAPLICLGVLEFGWICEEACDLRRDELWDRVKAPALDAGRLAILVQEREA